MEDSDIDAENKFLYLAGTGKSVAVSARAWTMCPKIQSVLFDRMLLTSWGLVVRSTTKMLAKR